MNLAKGTTVLREEDRCWCHKVPEMQNQNCENPKQASWVVCPEEGSSASGWESQAHCEQAVNARARAVNFPDLRGDNHRSPLAGVW